MAVVCPTVTANNPDQYREQIERLAPFARRVHLDFMDGVLAPTLSPDLKTAWWPQLMQADLHLMFKDPAAHVKQILKLEPQLVIVHAEADGDFDSFAAAMHGHGIMVGVALLPKTPARLLKSHMHKIDHILIFSGDLGHFGGIADLSLLAKAQECKHYKPSVEIGWDGGVNDQNVHILAAGGVDVLNVGGFIQKAADPAAAYATLETKLYG